MRKPVNVEKGKQGFQKREPQAKLPKTPPRPPKQKNPNQALEQSPLPNFVRRKNKKVPFEKFDYFFHDEKTGHVYLACDNDDGTVTEEKLPETYAKIYDHITTQPEEKERGTWETIWFNEEGIIDKENGPAYASSDGIKIWYKKGKAHKLDGPAVQDPYPLSCVFYVDGIETEHPDLCRKIVDKRHKVDLRELSNHPDYVVRALAQHRLDNTK